MAGLLGWAGALGPSVAAQQRPVLTVVSRLDTASDIAARAIVTAAAPGLRVRLLSRSERGSARLPDRGDWDIALGFPAHVLAAAERDGRLAELADGRPWAVVRILPYGPLSGSGPGPAWDEILTDPRGVFVPDPLAEPEFREALASLLAVYATDQIATLLNGARTVGRSRRIRIGLGRQQHAVGVVKLMRSEAERVDPLPCARLGVAVYARSRHRDAAIAAVKALLARAATWSASGPGMRPDEPANVEPLPLPDARQLDTIDRLARRRIPDAPVRDSEIDDWIETALLAGAAILLGLLVLAGARRRAP